LADSDEGSKEPSKNELKKRAKEAEKAKKAAEKAAKQAELAAQKEASEVVRTPFCSWIDLIVFRTSQQSSMESCHFTNLRSVKLGNAHKSARSVHLMTERASMSVLVCIRAALKATRWYSLSCANSHIQFRPCYL
jgi:hypothetical protein